MKKTNFVLSNIILLMGILFYLLPALSYSQTLDPTQSIQTEKPYQTPVAQQNPPQNSETDLNHKEDSDNEESLNNEENLTENMEEPLFDEKEALIHYQDGLKLYQKRDFGNAIIELEKAIDINPDYKEAYYLLGYAYYKEGKMEPSRNAFNQVYELDHHYSPRLPK